jgi:hypothetical protein
VGLSLEHEEAQKIIDQEVEKRVADGLVKQVLERVIASHIRTTKSSGGPAHKSGAIRSFKTSTPAEIIRGAISILGAPAPDSGERRLSTLGLA